MPHDVAIIGAGPAGLSAALTLARARKHVLLLDAGPRRNAKATHLHNFITRDGTPPTEFRALARKDLARYPNVEVRDVLVDRITGERGAFVLHVEGQPIEARRVLLATGLVDDVLDYDGYRELWGEAIFQCPYCHGFEVKDRRWAYLVHPANAAHAVHFALLLRSWTDDVVLFTGGLVPLEPEARETITAAGIPIEERRITRFRRKGTTLEALELEGGEVARDVVFVHPPQRQIPLVRALGEELGLVLDQDGSIHIDPMRRETSIPGLYAAGDAMTRAHAAIIASAAGMQAAAAINGDLQMELTRG